MQTHSTAGHGTENVAGHKEHTGRPHWRNLVEDAQKMWCFGIRVALGIRATVALSAQCCWGTAGCCTAPTHCSCKSSWTCMLQALVTCTTLAWLRWLHLP